jgi:prepilin-type N-terminal cleavage/methylation domain-containing protein
MLLTKRGFTLVELLIALVLMGIVSAAIYTLLINNQRLYRQQTQSIAVNDNLRSAVAILTSELRELDVADPLGSDIIDMTATSITYRGMRGLRWVCLGPTVGNVLAVDTTRLGLRPIDATYDSLLIYADSNPMLQRDDHWYHADVTSSPNNATDCAGGSRRINFTVSLGGRTSLAAQDDVIAGAPVRVFEIARMTSYQDVSGATWLGMQRYAKGAGWTNLQPVVGPLQAGGLAFAYYDGNGNVTTDRTRVARVQITVIARTSDKVLRLTSGGAGYLVDTLVTQVALRNSR